MNKITKDELKEAVSHKLRFSFDLPKFNEEERERIIEKMSGYWPDFYDGTKNTIGSVLFVGFLCVFGATKYYGESNWLISLITYAFCSLILLSVAVFVFGNYWSSAKDESIFKMNDVIRWAMKSKYSFIGIVVNITYLGLSVLLFVLHYWFVATCLLIAFGMGVWLHKRHNEEIINRLSSLAKVGKNELG